MNTVIYARYSCSGQREESIEGQVEACYKYAKERNLSLIPNSEGTRRLYRS